MARVRSTLPTTRAPTRCSPGDLVREAQMRRLHRRSPMSTTVARYLPMLAPIVLFVACSTDSRDLPSAPSITAHQMAADRSAVPSPRGTLQMVHDPAKDRLYLVGGISPVPCEDLACANSLLDDLWSFHPRPRTWTWISDQLPPRERDAA